jgi:hypothetical protein
MTCVSPYSADQTLRHPPDGNLLRSARVVEAGKEALYSLLDRDHYGFLPWAFDVFGGVAPTADEFFLRFAAGAVRKRTTLKDGPAFLAKYEWFSILITNWGCCEFIYVLTPYYFWSVATYLSIQDPNTPPILRFFLEYKAYFSQIQRFPPVFACCKFIYVLTSYYFWSVATYLCIIFPII